MSEAGFKKKNRSSIFFQYRDIVFQLSFEVPFTFNASTLMRALSIKYKSKQIKLFPTVQTLLVSDSRHTDAAPLAICTYFTCV